MARWLDGPTLVRADFPKAADEMIAAYGAEGLSVEVDLRLDTFARLLHNRAAARHFLDVDAAISKGRYGVDAGYVAQLRDRVEDWRLRLVSRA